MDKDLVSQVVEVAQRVVASGAISANGHGKWAFGCRGRKRCTSRRALAEEPCRVRRRAGWAGRGPVGRCPATGTGRRGRHAHRDVRGRRRCRLRPAYPFAYATAYAVAHRPIGCWVEALAMFGYRPGCP